MKLITLYVGKRLDHVINFDDEGQGAETYIIEKGAGNAIELFSFYHLTNGTRSRSRRNNQSQEDNAVIFQCDEGQKEVYIQKFEVKIAETSNEQDFPQHGIDLTVYLSQNRENENIDWDNPDNLGLAFTHDTTNPLWALTYSGGNEDVLMIKVKFVLLNELNPNLKKDKEMYLCVAKPESICDALLDFGSEASQMALFGRNEQQRVDGICDLFDDMKELLAPKQDNSQGNHEEMQNAQSTTDSEGIGNSYVQEDPSNKYLFKSVFYTKRAFTDEEAGDTIPRYNEDGSLQKGIVEMLTTYKEAQDLLKTNDYFQIPNVKLSGFGGVDLPKVKVGGQDKQILNYKKGYFYRININHFILNILKKSPCPCVCLYVLMPNIYSQLEINRHLDWIRQDIKTIINNEKANLKEHIKAVEISAISESDASLLGVVNAIKSRNDAGVNAGKYIIIDAGKGTLDFSAIEYVRVPNDKFRSFYRSGIIGAGNALTYAYFYALLYDYLSLVLNDFEADKVRDFIHKLLTRGDIADIARLMQAVEQYKIHVNDYTPDNNIKGLENTAKEDSVGKIETTAVTQFIKNLVNNQSHTYKPLSEEAQKYVSNTIDQIVEEVCGSLSILKSMKNFGKADRVIFAGRGFRLKEFKDKMMKGLQNGELVDEELNYQRRNIALDEKNVCLYIRSSFEDGAYNNHMYSVPIVFSKENHSDGSTEEKDTVTTIQERLGFVKGGWFDNLIKQFHIGKLSVFSGKKKKGNGSTPIIVNSRESNYNRYHTPGKSEDNGLVYGYTCSVNINERLMIGGVKYDKIPHDTEISIFFTNKDILCRFTNEEGISEVTKLKENGVNLQTSPFLFGTLFPNISIDNVNDVKLPYTKEGEAPAQTPEPGNGDNGEKNQSNENKTNDKGGSEGNATQEAQRLAAEL